MIKIFTVYFEGKYRPDYVTKLYRSLKRNCKVPFEFICLSDTKEVEADKVIMLPKWSDIKIHWHKLKFFSPLFGDQKPGDEIIVMDIDQIIVGDITDMINYPVGENELVSYRKWWKKGDPCEGNTVKLNGGWYKFKSGSLKFVWDEFSYSEKSRDKWQLYYYNEGIVHFKYYGEQNYVEDCCKRNNVNCSYVETSQSPGKEESRKLGINGFPTTLIYKDGKKVEEIGGYMKAEDFLNVLKKSMVSN